MDSSNTDPAHRVKSVGSEALNIVELGELSTIIGGYVLLEFPQCLASEIASINQKKHPSRISKFNKAVDETNSGICLTATGRHLYERSWPCLNKGIFQVFNGLDLANP